MKKILFLLFLFACLSMSAQIITNFPNSTPATSKDGTHQWNVVKVEIYESCVLVKYEITTLERIKRLNIYSDSGKLIYGDANERSGYGLGLKGIYYDGKVQYLGTNSRLGWDNVDYKEKLTFTLCYDRSGNSLPSGVQNISVYGVGVDVDGKRTSWRCENLIINNPRNNYTDFDSENSIRQHLDLNNDGICGIYEDVDGEYNSRFACVKYNGKHTLIFLSDNMGRSWWKTGDIKAELIPSEHEGLFTANWYMSDKSVNKEVIIGFDKNIMSAIFSPGKSNEESNYYKRVYPTELPIKAQLNEVIPLLENENFQEAVKSLSRIIDRINRTSQSKQAYKNEAYSAYMLRAYAYIALELYKSALLDYDNALICKPGDENAYYQRGRLKLELNDINGAIDDMKRGGEMGRAILREYGLLNNNSQRTNGNTPPLKKQQMPELKKQQ